MFSVVQAIMALLGYLEKDPTLELVAITTVAGNVEMEQATVNVAHCLAAWGKLGAIPVFKGAVGPLCGKRVDASEWHGKDGLGGADVGPDRTSKCVLPGHAATEIVRILNEARDSGDKIHVVTIGPLTNLALAVRLDPGIVDGVDRLTFMGGTDAAVGNITPAAEFNVYCDPEAAQICLECFPNVTMVGWEATLNHDLPWDWVDSWLEETTDQAKFLASVTRSLIGVSKTDLADWGFLMPDPLALATILDPSSVIKTVSKPIYIDTSISHSRGLVIVDWRSGKGDHTGDLPKDYNMCRIVRAVDMAKFEAVLMVGAAK